MSSEDIDIRPVLVDKLATFEEVDLTSRLTRIDALLQEFEARVAELQEQLEKSNQLVKFLNDEREKVLLARQLRKGDVVRVICPACKGSGMKSADVTSGRVSAPGSAFESIQGGVTVAPEDDPLTRCTTCSGKKWVIMERYKG